MSSPQADRAIAEALDAGGAFLKVVQPNDVGVTGGHQKGFHLSKRVWSYFTPQSPEKGVNHDFPVTIHWANGTVTNSVIKWYGKGSRSEYRLTSFNRIHGFHYLDPKRLGGLLVLVARPGGSWFADVLDDASDVDDITATLGVSLDDSSWAYYTAYGADDRSGVSVDDCEREAFDRHAESLDSFPTTKVMSGLARQIVNDCWQGPVESVDDYLIHLVRAE